MEARRAFEILSALVQRLEPAAAPTEVGELGGAGLVRTVERPTKEQMESVAAQLRAVTQRVRELGRRLAGQPDDNGKLRAELREETGRLEELSRTRSRLDALVWNAPSQTFLLPTLEGRRLLADLATWRDRFGEGALFDFLSRMARLRKGLDATVVRAGQILPAIFEFEPNATRSDLRAPALILARQGTNTVSLAVAYEVSLRHLRVTGVSLEDRLLIAAMLSGDLEPTEELARFDESREALRDRGLARDAEAVVAASLVDFPADRRVEQIVRFDAVRRMDDSLDSVEASVLARSPYAPSEAYERYRTALEHTVRARAGTGDRPDAAAAILAASTGSIEAALERFDRHLGQVAGMFDVSSVAAAMLTGSALDPAQALDILKESVGAVTRGNYFEMTFEIPGLALLLVHGTGPEITRFVVDSGMAFPGVAPAMPTGPARAYYPIRDTSWYLWHDRWLYRPTLRYVRTHPLHVHTVPHFG